MNGLVYKSVAKNAAFIFIIKLFPVLANVIVLILYSRELSETDYGNYQEFWVKYLLLGTLAYAGLPVTIITYAPEMIKAIINRLRLKQYTLYLCWFFFWCILFSFLMRKDLQLPAYLSVSLLALYVAHSLQESMILISRQMKGLMIVNFLYAVYFLILHVWILPYYDLTDLLGFLLIGLIVRSLILAIFLKGIYSKLSPIKLESKNLNNIRHLWLHLGLYDLLQNVFRFADKFVISSFLAASVYAIYFNGAQTAEVPLLPYLLGAVSSSILIQLSSGKEQAPGTKHLLLRYSAMLLSSIVFPIFFFLFFFSRELFLVILTEKYLESVPIFTIAILVLPLRSYNYTVLLQHFEKGKLINLGALLDLLLAMALILPLYRLFGLPGIVLSFVISTYLQVLFYLYHTSRITSISITDLLPLKNWLSKLVLFGLILFLTSRILSVYVSGLELLLGGFAITAALIGASTLLEWRRLKEKFKKAS